MTEQLPAQEAAPRGRALAPLSSELGTDERAFAEHLRGLRERSAKTSADLAAALEVDATRLSRYLSGQSLPEPQLLIRFHQLLADGDAETSPPLAAQESRALLYAAARSKGPLSARAYEIAELQEKLHEQQAETASSLAALQAEMQHERDHRRRAEQEIARLRQAGVADRDAQIRRLEAERDSALHRVAELEDLVSQTGALLQLQQSDAQHAEEMAAETRRAMDRWEHGAPEQSRKFDLTRWDAEEIVDKLDDLRDADRDEEADGLLADVVQGQDPALVAQLHCALEGAGRRVDGAKLLKAAAMRCPGTHLRRLALAVGENDAPGDTGEFQIIVPPAPLGDALLPIVGRLSPVDTVLRLAVAFAQRSERPQLEALTFFAAARAKEDRQVLRDAGLPVTQWHMERQAWRRPRLHIRDCEAVMSTHDEQWLTTTMGMTKSAAKEQGTKFGLRTCPQCHPYLALNAEIRLDGVVIKG
ncbi:helix-turn-helix domain-containing protein [Streptomyces sioyaensis]|uniref:helix-turn-helix domain-containing protein n=1 Tax=Streptomyces sioyaensis TaxID=67364 RepID=UPI001F2ADDBD|nr:helix-turn-helix transcriptional regulator [Streptomyces sioyaensis]MCF3173938.1 helix-turn-helix domain-containing protein [Streptomyces sioyaensis]